MCDAASAKCCIAGSTAATDTSLDWLGMYNVACVTLQVPSVVLLEVQLPRVPALTGWECTTLHV